MKADKNAQTQKCDERASVQQSRRIRLTGLSAKAPSLAMLTVTLITFGPTVPPDILNSGKWH